ncbi:hypothetical protein GGH20_005279, partial [Coemansia sp. RSA 1937]
PTSALFPSCWSMVGAGPMSVVRVTPGRVTVTTSIDVSDVSDEVGDGDSDEDVRSEDVRSEDVGEEEDGRSELESVGCSLSDDVRGRDELSRLDVDGSALVRVVGIIRVVRVVGIVSVPVRAIVVVGIVGIVGIVSVPVRAIVVVGAVIHIIRVIIVIVIIVAGTRLVSPCLPVRIKQIHYTVKQPARMPIHAMLYA